VEDAPVNDSREDELRRRYAFDEWRGHNALDEDLLIWKYFLVGKELSGWSPTRIQESIRRDGVRHILSMWKAAGRRGFDEGLARVDIFEFDARAAAHEFLLGTLGQFQSPNIRRLQPPPVGDVAFAPQDQGADTLVFSRANVVVWARNAGRDEAPVGDLAAQLDRQFVEKPVENADVLEGLSPRIRSFGFAKEQVNIGETVAINIEAADPAGRPLWFKFFAKECEFRIDDGRPSLKILGEGQREVTVVAVNPLDGTTSKASWLQAR
jgi:hypothetical protein